jgi:AraC-type DNA-binding domain-containing proteins
MDESAWIIEAPGGREEQHFDGSELLNFDNGSFRGFIERVPLRRGTALYRVSGSSDHPWTLSALGSSPPGNLVLGTLLGGAGTIDADGNEGRTWRAGGSPYILSLADREIAYRIEANEKWRAVTLLLEPEALEDLASEEQLPPIVRAVLDNGYLPVLEVLKADRTIARLAHELFDSPYRGRMGKLWRESKALELLACQLDRLAESSPVRPDLNARDVLRIREVHEMLLSDLRSPPDIQALAVAARMSPRRLNQGFRQIYGMTVFEALLEARMQAAHYMVRECPEVPLKNVAWQVGYNQLSNFINAYRRRFGISPGQDRRSGESA